MAYLPMTQDVIRFMNSSFNKEDLTSYQMLLILFGKLFADEEEFLKDSSDRMGLSHYVENFLRQNNFQTIVTIKDLNMIFNNTQGYDINDKSLYEVFFVLIYEELSANDPQISYKIKEAVFNLINLIQESLNNQEEMPSAPIVDTTPVDENVPSFVEPEAPLFIPEEQPTFIPFEQNPVNPVDIIEAPMANEVAPEAYVNINSALPFVVHNKKYLKEFIQRKNLIPYRCSICGLSEWQNEPLCLELDSYNGIFTSTNLNNLRFLCPNCFSQVGHGE